MKIMKFGGTSVGSTENISRVSRIIKEYSQHESIVVVVSAVSGVTDKLISLFKEFKNGNRSEGLVAIHALYKKHLHILQELALERVTAKEYEDVLKKRFGELLTCLTFKEIFAASDYDCIVSFGERVSAPLVVAALGKIGVIASDIDSARVIVTTNEYGNAQPLLPETEKKAQRVILPLLIKGIVPVVTGFFGATKEGKVTLLGRGGSDYSATILAHSLDAQEVILWKEVDGIFTTDPKKDTTSQFLSQISYKEALILAQNGAKVLHPEAMKPVAEKDIVVWVKNTFRPEFVGSKIWKGTL